MGSGVDLKGVECVLLRAKDEGGLEAAGQPSQPPADRPAVIARKKSLGVCQFVRSDVLALTDANGLHPPSLQCRVPAKRKKKKRKEKKKKNTQQGAQQPASEGKAEWLERMAEE